MRITNNILSRNFLNNLNTNLGNLTENQRQIASGKALNSLSDDPVKLISSLQFRAKLRQIDQHKSAVESSTTWLEQTESSISELNEVLKSAYETAVEAANDYLTPEDKMAAAEYIKQLRDQVVTIANNQSSDKYIFGGYNVNSPPLVADGTGGILYNGMDLTDAANPALIAASGQKISYEIGYNTEMVISVTGPELLGSGEDNIYSVLNNLTVALQSDAGADEISSYISKLQDAQSRTLNIQTRVGGMINRLDLMKNRYEEETLSYTQQKSNVEDVDIAEAYTNYSMAQAVYNAALQVGTEIIQKSILDYMR